MNICYKNGLFYKEYQTDVKAEVDTKGNESRYYGTPKNSNHLGFVGIKTRTPHIKNYTLDINEVPSNNVNSVTGFDGYGYYDEDNLYLDCYNNMLTTEDYIAVCSKYGFTASQQVISYIDEAPKAENLVSALTHGCIFAITFINGTAVDEKVYINVPS